MLANGFDCGCIHSPVSRLSAPGFLTAATLSLWPDLIVGLGIAALNADAAREVYRTAKNEKEKPGAARTGVATMSRTWGVEVQGAEVDVTSWKDNLKPPDELHVLILEELEEKPLVLCSTLFDRFERATEVFEIGKILVGQLNAALAALAGARSLRATGMIIQFRDGDRPRKHYVLEVEPATFEVRVHPAKLTVTDKDGHVVVPEPLPSKVQVWMSAARRSDPIADALSFLQRPTDWFELWKAYEALNDHGLAKESIPKAKRTLFTRTANAIHRHREGKFEAPDSPMEIREAVALVRTMLESAITEVQTDTAKK